MAGQYYDTETGLFYNWNRYYIPELGRYNRVDPIGLKDGTNPFNYVHANPIAKVDPDGQWAMLEPVVVIVGGYVARRFAMALLRKALSGGDDVNDNSDDDCDDNDDNSCGPLTRVQALALAQEFAQVSRKKREYYPFSKVDRQSRGLCFNRLQEHGANHVGYICTWQNNARVEDHPDGHPHQMA